MNKCCVLPSFPLVLETVDYIYIGTCSPPQNEKSFKINTTFNSLNIQLTGDSELF